MTDTPLFGVGTTVTGGSCVAAGAGAADCAGVTGVPAPSWTVAAAGTAIAAGGNHTYTITVSFTVAPGSLTSDGNDCSLATGSTTNTGLLNRATMTPEGGSAINQDACAPIPGNVSHTKTVSAGPTLTGLNTYTVTYAINVGNTGGTASTYGLTDTPLFVRQVEAPVQARR